MRTASLSREKILSGVREEVKSYSNFQAIMDKVEQDGHLLPVLESFKRIFEDEIMFAHRGFLNRT